MYRAVVTLLIRSIPFRHVNVTLKHRSGLRGSRDSVIPIPGTSCLIQPAGIAHMLQGRVKVN